MMKTKSLYTCIQHVYVNILKVSKKYCLVLGAGIKRGINTKTYVTIVKLNNVRDLWASQNAT